MKQHIEISTTNAPGLSFRVITYPTRKHYALQIGRTEARIITDPKTQTPLRAFTALALVLIVAKLA